MTPAQQLQAISQRAHRMATDQYACFMQGIEPALAAAGSAQLPQDMNERQSASANRLFEGEILPF